MPKLQRQLSRQGQIITLVASLVVAAVAGSYLVQSRASDNSYVDATATGTLIVSMAEADGENGEGEAVTQYALKLADGSYRTLETGEHPLRARTGAKLKVAGRHRKQSPKVIEVDTSKASGVQVLDGSTGQTDAVATPLPEATSPLKALESANPLEAVANVARSLNVGVVLVRLNVTDGSKVFQTGTPITTADAEARNFASTDSVKAVYAESSGGRIGVGGKVLGTATINVSGRLASSCETDVYHTWADLADASLRSQGISLSGFTNVQYLLAMVQPGAGSTGCFWSGIADMGLTRSWFMNAAQGITIGGKSVPNSYWAVPYAHEIGHNLDLRHSNIFPCQTADGHPVTVGSDCDLTKFYGDPFDFMGNAFPGMADGAGRQLNNIHRTKLSLIPASLTQEIATSGTYSLAPVTSNPGAAGPQSLRVPYYSDFDLMIEYRQPSGTYDNFSAADPVATGVTLRLMPKSDNIFGDSWLLDASPASSARADAPLTHGTFYNPETGTAVTLVSATSSRATVKIQANASEPAAPVVTAVTPASARAGETVTLRGSGFWQANAYPEIGGTIPTQYTAISDTEIRVVVPALAAGSAAVKVFSSWGSSTMYAGSFSVLAGTVTTPAPGGKAGDFNGDGRVGIIDLSTLLAGWGKAGTADLNGDGTVGIIDLSKLLAAWTG